MTKIEKQTRETLYTLYNLLLGGAIVAVEPKKCTVYESHVPIACNRSATFDMDHSKNFTPIGSINTVLLVEPVAFTREFEGVRIEPLDIPGLNHTLYLTHKNSDLAHYRDRWMRLLV